MTNDTKDEGSFEAKSEGAGAGGCCGEKFGQAQGSTGSSCPFACAIDFKGILERVKEIFTRPNTFWEGARSSEDSVQSLYLNYIAILAAIPVVCQFLRMTIVGISIPFFNMTYRWPFFHGIATAIAMYLMSLLSVYVVALVLEKLAPRFEGNISQIDALRLVAYCSTPMWIAGIFHLVPALSALLGLVAFIFGLYLFYQGVCQWSGVPGQKRLVFLLCFVGCVIVVFIVLGIVSWIVGPKMPMPDMGNFGMPPIK